MSMPELAPAIIQFYSHTINEAERLTASADGHLELVRTQELLRRHLPAPPAQVLDVGGGPGVHARWLQEDGHAVHLVDPVPRHVTQAELSGCSAELGDARQLTAGDSSFDAVLLLGPLYHLPARADRTKALDEAYRVVKPGGTVAVAGISRYSALFEHAALAHLHNERLQTSISEILSTAKHDGAKGFTIAYFHTGEELREEMQGSGFTDIDLYGIEGPAWSLLRAVERDTGDSITGSNLFESALIAARMAEPYPDLLAASSHLLAVGRKADL